MNEEGLTSPSPLNSTETRDGCRGRGLMDIERVVPARSPSLFHSLAVPLVPASLLEDHERTTRLSKPLLLDSRFIERSVVHWYVTVHLSPVEHDKAKG